MRRTELRRTSFRRKPAREPIELTKAREEVYRRSGGKCEVKITFGCQGPLNWGVHHRQLRRHKNHTPENLIGVCEICHEWIHRNVAESYKEGWLVHHYENPSLIPWTKGV